MTATTLGEVCEVLMGQAPPGNSYNTDGRGLPLLAGAGDFGDRTPTPHRFTITPTKLSRPGDILFCVRATIGERNWSDREYCLGRGVAALRPRDSVLHADYLWHWLPSVAPTLARRAHGSTFKQVTRDAVESLRIDLPPLPEQRRIAAVLDRADAIRRKRRESLRLLDDFLRSAFLEMFGGPLSNPRGWETKLLGEIADFIGGGTPSRAVPAYFNGSICWATAKDIQTESLIDTQEHITSEAIENSATKLVPVGTILVVVKSKVLMHRLPVAITEVPACFGQDLKGIVLHDGHSAHYIARHLRLGQRWLLGRARGANTEGLTLDHLRRFPIMVPPSDLIERYDGLERHYRKTRERLTAQATNGDALFDSLAQRAFRGEL